MIKHVMITVAVMALLSGSLYGMDVDAKSSGNPIDKLSSKYDEIEGWTHYSYKIYKNILTYN